MPRSFVYYLTNVITSQWQHLDLPDVGLSNGQRHRGPYPYPHGGVAVIFFFQPLKFWMQKAKITEPWAIRSETNNVTSSSLLIWDFLPSRDRGIPRTWHRSAWSVSPLPEETSERKGKKQRTSDQAAEYQTSTRQGPLTNHSLSSLGGSTNIPDWATTIRV